MILNHHHLDQDRRRHHQEGQVDDCHQYLPQDDHRLRQPHDRRIQLQPQRVKREIILERKNLLNIKQDAGEGKESAIYRLRNERPVRGLQGRRQERSQGHGSCRNPGAGGAVRVLGSDKIFDGAGPSHDVVLVSNENVEVSTEMDRGEDLILWPH